MELTCKSELRGDGKDLHQAPSEDGRGTLVSFSSYHEKDHQRCQECLGHQDHLQSKVRNPVLCVPLSPGSSRVKFSTLSGCSHSMSIVLLAKIPYLSLERLLKI